MGEALKSVNSTARAGGGCLGEVLAPKKSGCDRVPHGKKEGLERARNWTGPSSERAQQVSEDLPLPAYAVV